MELITPAPRLYDATATEEERAAHLQAAGAAFDNERTRLQACLDRQAERQAELSKSLERELSVAEQRHAEIEASLRALALALGGLDGAEAQPQLATLSLTAAYADGCRRLQQALHRQLEEAAGASDGEHAAQRRFEAQQADLQFLQRALSLSAKTELTAQVGVARASAELGLLQRACGGGAPAGAEAGAALLRQQVEAAEGRLGDALAEAEALAAEVGAQPCLGVVEAQCASRLAAAQACCRASEEVAGALAQHVARQLQLERVRRGEAAAVREMHAAAAAAAADAELVLRATQLRLADAAQQTQQEQRERPDGQLPHDAPAEEGVGAATADQLLHLRSDMGRLSGEVTTELLPRYRAGFGRLHALAYTGPDLSRPALTDPALAARLATASEAAAALQRQAAAVLGEVAERQRAQARRALPESVLVDFFLAPERLPAAAERNRQLLEGKGGKAP